MGLNGFVYESGLFVMVWEIFVVIVMVVIVLFLLLCYLKGGFIIVF